MDGSVSHETPGDNSRGRSFNPMNQTGVWEGAGGHREADVSATFWKGEPGVGQLHRAAKCS